MKNHIWYEGMLCFFKDGYEGIYVLLERIKAPIGSRGVEKENHELLYGWRVLGQGNVKEDVFEDELDEWYKDGYLRL